MAEDDPTREELELILGAPIFIAQTLGVFLGVYGWERFVFALAGAVFLYYAYTLVLLPRLGDRRSR